MSRYRFSKAERYGVWEAHGGQCYWCRCPLELKECTVDHVLPEKLLDDPTTLASLRSDLGLDDEFAINGFENWVLACKKCNGDKSDILIRSTIAIQIEIQKIAKRGQRAKQTAENTSKNTKRDKVLGKLMAAMESGEVAESDVLDLLAAAGPPTAEQEGLELQLSPGWKVVKREQNLVWLERGGRVGYTSILPERDRWSWTCPSCGNEGPWNGVICLSCGMRSEPD